MKAGLGLVLVALALAGCQRAGEEQACAPPSRVSPVTGFCLPRWVSLRSDDVDGRKGPGEDYPAIFIYHVRGLPVQLVEETSDWRRICDPDGGAAWVHRSMIDGRRTVMAGAAAAAPMHRAPDGSSPIVGLLNPRALASLTRCQGDWCKVSVQGHNGWIAATGLWGAASAPACR